MFALENVDLVIKDVHFVKKFDIEHAFAITDSEYVNSFVMHTFHHWEHYTFETFEMVKDKEGVAIDIGAWIGTTGIWLSKNFSNVVCIEADNESIKHLKVNLKLSNCKNAVVCENPISNDCSKLVFGPRNAGGAWNNLNHSTSYLKAVSDSKYDYTKKCMTFKQIIYNYTYDMDKKVTFIKCDIEGGEDVILDDIFHYCLTTGASAYISFHLVWWKRCVDLQKYVPYFKYFDCYELYKQVDDVLTHVRKDQFCSILFRPKLSTEAQGLTAVKKINPTVLITSYKDIEELQKILPEIRKHTDDIIIVSTTDQAVLDELPYFILKEAGTKQDRFIKYLIDNNCIVFDSNKITELLANVDLIKDIIYEQVLKNE